MSITLTEGRKGWLEFKTRPVDGHGQIAHSGEYRYEGKVTERNNGTMRHFTQHPFGQDLYLHDDEILAFGPKHAITFLIEDCELVARCTCGWEHTSEGDRREPYKLAGAILLAGFQHCGSDCQ